jgi:hypothetical protein
MIKFLGQMLKLPVAAFVASVETIARAMRDFQKTFDQSVEIVTGSADVPLGDMESGKSPRGDENSEPQTERGNCKNSEDGNMPDQDLSGDDLKIVRYKIIYTKRGYERFLHAGDGLVNYNTTAADWGGLKVSEWMENPANQAFIQEHHLLDWDNKIYITTFVEVLQRFPKQEKEYDRQQVRVLEEIRDRI